MCVCEELAVGGQGAGDGGYGDRGRRGHVLPDYD